MLGLNHLAIGETFNRTLTLTIILIAISQFNYGFDQQGFNSTQAMDAFARQYGSYNSRTKQYALDTVWLSLFASLPLLGMAVGILVGSIVSNRYGRRMCMFSMSIWSLVATTVVITSRSSGQILAGRVLLYIYIGMQLSVVPIYQSEITPKNARGFIVGTFQLSLGIGGLVINGVARATGSLESNAAFLIPYGLFYIVPTIVICGTWFVPESPRWLALKGRDADALASLTRLREGKFTPEEIASEIALIKAAIDHEVEKGSFTDMFKSAQTAKRTIAVIGANIFIQANGYQIVSVYGAIFVKSLGFMNPFTFTIINAALQVVLVFVAMVLMDKLGRRQVLFIGGTLQMASVFAMAGLGTSLDTHASSTSIKSGIVATLILMTSGFILGWAPTGHVLSAEIPSMKLRDVTYRTASVLQILTQFVVTFSLPYLLNAPYADLGPKVGFIYGFITFLSLLFAYFCVPECKGRTLEEIDALFDTKVPVRHFAKIKLETPLDDIAGKKGPGIEVDGDGKEDGRVVYIEDSGEGGRGRV